MEEQERAAKQETASVDYESAPLSRPEYIAAVVHLYRGELYRATAWRIRLDTTTNWAVITTAGLLSFSFRDGGHSHWTLLTGMGLISVFLAFEARRFRLADVWRARVRKIEENFYGPILRRELQSPESSWGMLVADDLFHPKYKISRLMSLRVRFARNYWPIYLLLLVSWCVHVVAFPAKATDWAGVQQNLAMGLVPWWFPLAVVIGFVVAIVLMFVLTPGVPKTEMEHWQTPLEERGDEPILDV